MAPAPPHRLDRPALTAAAFLLAGVLATEVVVWAATLEPPGPYLQGRDALLRRGTTPWIANWSQGHLTGYAVAYPIRDLEHPPDESEWQADDGGFARHMGDPLPPGLLRRLGQILDTNDSVGRLTLAEAGWPFRAQWGCEVEFAANVSTASKAIGIVEIPMVLRNWRMPVRILWPGFLADSLLYAAAGAAIVCGFRLAVRTRRRLRGRCPKCAYDLGRDFSSGCPECGWNRVRVTP